MNSVALKIEGLINQKINIQHIDIIDDSHKHRNHKKDTQGGHYKLFLVSDYFQNMNLIDRHKVIYNILDSMIKTEIHALSMKLLTASEYKKIIIKYE